MPNRAANGGNDGAGGRSMAWDFSNLLGRRLQGDNLANVMASMEDMTRGAEYSQLTPPVLLNLGAEARMENGELRVRTSEVPVARPPSPWVLTTAATSGVTTVMQQ